LKVFPSKTTQIAHSNYIKIRTPNSKANLSFWWRLTGLKRKGNEFLRFDPDQKLNEPQSQIY
jgi:hypothetical protein